MPETLEQTVAVTPEFAGNRLDQCLAAMFPEFSRARLQRWVRQGHILVDGRQVKPGFKLTGAESIHLSVALDAVDPDQAPPADPIQLDIVHQDESVLVINKPAGLVVHPAAGHARGTLQNALVFLDEKLAAVPRCGIVHRLDKLTSGIMVVARTLSAHASLVEQLQQRSMSRQYLALVYGALVSGGSVDEPIGRHPRDRKKMAVHELGKPAVTHYRINRRFRDFTLLDVHLETGRTHQIRVHMNHVHHPLVGDPVYGVRLRLPAGAGETLQTALRGFGRQALHAARLAFHHPAMGEPVEYRAAVPEDMGQLIQALDQEPSQRP
ncbi:MAG: 23S rRNA pseudouridine(1911/1915/1917) synthase RluD [Xanthomonadales bacterium]|nr:23S rRNA pseudouridine(1911/1915/1917) synthase RluD [Xanthomonadales bacterium]